MPFTRVTLETSSPVTSSKTQRSAQDLPVKDVPFVKAMVTDPKVFPAASVHLPGPQGPWRTRLGSPQSMKVKVGEEEGVDVGLAVTVLNGLAAQTNVNKRGILLSGIWRVAAVDCSIFWQ